jgi:hypothetical protein
MKNLIEKVSTTISSTLVLLVGLVMAGLGVMTMALLGVFALAALGLAMLAAPFIARPKRDVEDAEFEPVNEADTDAGADVDAEPQPAA